MIKREPTSRYKLLITFVLEVVGNFVSSPACCNTQRLLPVMKSERSCLEDNGVFTTPGNRCLVAANLFGMIPEALVLMHNNDTVAGVSDTHDGVI